MACERLPTNKNFLRSLGWNRPRPEGKDGISLEPDWQFNETIKPVVQIINTESSIQRLAVTLPGYRLIRSRKTEFPEVKEAGKPYQPGRTEYTNEGVETFDGIVCYCEVREMNLDPEESV